MQRGSKDCSLELTKASMSVAELQQLSSLYKIMMKYPLNPTTESSRHPHCIDVMIWAIRVKFNKTELYSLAVEKFTLLSQKLTAECL